MSRSNSSTAVLNIATPEGVTFSLPLAGPVTRAMGFLVDFGVTMAIGKVIKTLAALAAFVSMDFSGALGILFQFIVMFGYATVCELLFNGQTVGKRVMRIRVMDERGLRLNPGQVLIRNLLRVADMLPIAYALGGAFCLFSKRCQRLGDLAAGTVVVRDVKTTPPEIENVLGGKYNSFRDHPHIEARLRQKISPDEAQVALAALTRVDELEPEARLKVFSLMAERFRQAAVFPEETVFGLTDEQYVRNSVDSIYRKSR